MRRRDFAALFCGTVGWPLSETPSWTRRGHRAARALYRELRGRKASLFLEVMAILKKAQLRTAVHLARVVPTNARITSAIPAICSGVAA